MNGAIANHNDASGSIRIHDLAILDNPNYDHLDYYAGGSQGLEGVVTNTISLCKRQRELLTSDKWINFDQIESYKDQNFKNRFGIERPKNSESFMLKIKQLIARDFSDFELLFDNSALPHYHEDSTLQQLIYSFDKKEIKIKQYCYRDYPRVYEVFIDESLLVEVDLEKVSQATALEKIVNTINSQ